MRTWAEERAVFERFVDVVSFASELSAIRDVRSELESALGLPPAPAVEHTGSDPLTAVMALGSPALTDGHARARRALRRSLVRQRADLVPCFDAFAGARFGIVDYAVDASGWHTVAWSDDGAAPASSDGFATLEAPAIVVADRGWCCERCDGPRVADPREAEVQGAWAGWLVSPGVTDWFLALGRVEPWAREATASIADVRQRAVRAVLAPWSRT